MVAWAKLKITDLGIETHSLVAHSADAGAVMERLLAIPTIADRLARLAGMASLTPVTIARLSLLAAIHDAGKANRGFWNRLLLADGASFKDIGSLKAGHVGPVVNLMHSDNVYINKLKPRSHTLFVDSLGLDRLFHWSPKGHKGLNPLLNAVLMHHGRLPERKDICDPLWQADGSYDPATELNHIGSALEGWFPEAFSSELVPLPTENRFLHAFAGLVMLADWIASDERHFSFTADASPDRIIHARLKADEAIGRFFLDPSVARTPLQGHTDFTSPIIGEGRTPRPAQAAMARASVEPGSIIVIEAETGSGKTEAALIHFLNLFRAGKVGGLYFALPSRAAAVQIHRRIAQALKSLLGEAAPPVVLAVPGYMRVDDHDGAKLPDFKVQWPDDMDDVRRDSAWAAEHPKRYLASAVAVGTIDQLMLGALNVRHAHLRSGPMLRQLLVIDEVHASDPYMERIVRNLLVQHQMAGGHTLLMSATLGTSTRTRLMNEEAPRKDQPIEELIAQPYPAIHAANADVPTLPLLSGEEKKIDIELINVENPDRELATRAVDAALGGARVLIIRNRVKDAINTAISVAEIAAEKGVPDLAFRCEGIATVHHGRFAPSDRQLLDRALENALGRESTRPVICTATQTAEQSLDIDADILLTDICPADVLLQRMGRLHRHVRPRPTGFERARAIVLAPGEEQLADIISEKGTVTKSLLGLGKVYPDLVGIVATRRTLETLGTIHVPGHNRMLVERATHEPFLGALAQELGPRWGKYYNEILGIRGAEVSTANLNLLEFGKEIFPPIDIESRIATRLGSDNRFLPLETALPGPFGAMVASLTLPGWMAKDAPLDARPQAAKPIPGGFTFQYGKEGFVYDQWGLDKAKDN